MKIINEIIVKVIPQEFPASSVRCSVRAIVCGRIEHNFELGLPADDFESRFHRFMHIAEEEIMRVAKKEEEEDHATEPQRTIPSP